MYISVDIATARDLKYFIYKLYAYFYVLYIEYIVYTYLKLANTFLFFKFMFNFLKNLLKVNSNSLCTQKGDGEQSLDTVWRSRLFHCANCFTHA